MRLKTVPHGTLALEVKHCQIVENLLVLPRKELPSGINGSICRRSLLLKATASAKADIILAVQNCQDKRSRWTANSGVLLGDERVQALSSKPSNNDRLRVSFNNRFKMLSLMEELNPPFSSFSYN